MTEILEIINPEVMAILGEDCLFSHDDGPHDKKNDLSNSSKKLRRKLGAADGVPVPFTFELDGKKYDGEFGYNAHHILPADASVNDSPDLLKEMKKSDHLKGDVGYGVNHRKNGVFLPTEDKWDAAKYGLWSEIREEVDGYRMLYAYAYKTMSKTGRQFHTSHTDYSLWVKQRLEDIRVKMLQMKVDCDPCKTKNAKEPYNPPYEIVAKLDSIADHVRGYLCGSPHRWLAPIVTSDEAEFYGVGITPERMMAVDR